MKKLNAFLIIPLLIVCLTFSASASEITAEEKTVDIYAETETFSAKAQNTPLEEEASLETENKPSVLVTMALNNETVIVNGNQITSTAPILVFDKTYVDLYQIASFLGIGVEWVEDYIGFFRVSANGTTVDFTYISQWDDLIYGKNKFFLKDSKIYVTLREIAQLAGYKVSYVNGLITIGDGEALNSELFGKIQTYDYNDYIYSSYPVWAQYVVNPYQQYSYENMLDDAKKLEYMYPELVKTSSIGKSVEGRDLLLLEFGRGEDKIFVCGTHHAREYIATTYLMYAIDRYAYAYRTNSMWGKYSPKDLLDRITFCIVPMVNPDGVNLVQNGIYATDHASELSRMKINESAEYGYASWKANINGVDVNWNYNKDWSVKKNKKPRGSMGFNGDRPATEPETVAVSDYVDKNTFEAFLSFHTQGEIFYWADNPYKSTGIYQAIKNDTGFTGYQEFAEGDGGSFFDYVYRKFKKPTVTVELCPYVGNYPYPNRDFNTVWRPAKNVLLVVANEILYSKYAN